MTNRPTALAVLGATHGTCDTCGRVFRLRADRTTFHHLAAKALVHGYAKPQCRGSWKLPREVSPLYSETLRGKVTAAVETYLGPYSINPVPVANAVLQEIEPRLRHVEAQNAQLVDLVVAAAALTFGQVQDRGERDYLTEALHLSAVELQAQYPRLAGVYDGAPRPAGAED